MKIPAPNYTQTPNDLFDHWLPLLSEAELKVLLVIMRKTFGWHKTHDAISVSQLARHTGMLEETVINAAKSLQSKGVITREVIGQNGKQQTIYSLVVEEDSNNSYPSVEPRGPLGSDPPVQTEAQKKHLLKETLIKKQQQASPVSAAVSSKIEIFEEIKNIDIPHLEKEKICASNDRETVRNAVGWATDPLNPPKKCLAASIKFACQQRLSRPTPKEDVAKKNKNYALRYEGMKSGAKIVEVSNQYVEIHAPGHCYGSFSLGFEENGFIEQFTNELRKNNFKILEQP